MKRVSIFIALVIMLFSLNTVVFATESINVVIDGERVIYTEESGFPFVDVNGRTQVPLRITMEKFGASIGWIQEKRTVTIRLNNQYIEIPIGESYILNNGNKIMNDTAAIIKDGRTYLPIRVVLEELKATVNWDDDTRSVVVKRNTEYSQQAKDIFWKDRIWTGISNDAGPGLNIEEIQQLQAQIEIAQKECNNKLDYYNKLTDGLTSYLITGKVLMENDEYIIIDGTAYGFGEGMHEGALKVMKPTAETILGNYSDSNFYVDEELNSTYGTIKVYNNGSEEIIKAKQEKNKAASVLNSLKRELSKLTEMKNWWERPYYEKLSETKYKYYNLGALYTLEYPTVCSLEVHPRGTNLYDHLPNYETVINHGGFRTHIWDYTIQDEEIDDFYNDKIYGFEDDYKKLQELINSNNGINDAYLMYNTTWDKFDIYLFTDKNLVIRFSASKGWDFEKTYKMILEIIDSLVLYNAAG